MHILFLTDNFPPEVNAPAARTYEHARQWVRSGHRVTVVTGVPNFPRGEVFPGYRNRPWQTEILEGIRVVRVWTYVAPNRGFLRRTLDYASYMATSVLASPWVGDPDVVVGTSPQFFTVCAAYLVSRIRRLPFVFELRDLWPESIVTVGAMRPNAAIRLLEKIELFLYREAASVVALTPAFKENLVKRGVEGSKVHVIPNGVDLEFFAPGPHRGDLRKALGAEGKTVASYIGTVGMAHAVERIVEAACLLREDDRLLFLIVGHGAEWERIRRLVSGKGLDNVRVLPAVPRGDVVDYYRISDLFLVTLRDRELFRTVIPSKLFEAMAVGVPVVCAVDGQCRAIVEEAGAGVFVPPEDVASMARAIKALAERPEEARRMGENGRRFVEGRFDRKAMAAKLLAVLQEVAEGGRGRGGR